MLPITINGIEKNIPTKWDEVSVKQYRSLSEMILQDGDVKPFHILAALTGIEYQVAVNCDVDSFNKILPAIEFINVLFDERTIEVPDEIEIAGTKITIPKDITKECAGQFWDSYALQVAAEGKPLITIASELASIYLQPHYTNAIDKSDKYEYNEKKREGLTVLMDELPVTTVMPIAAFFLIKFYKLKTINVPS